VNEHVPEDRQWLAPFFDDELQAYRDIAGHEAAAAALLLQRQIAEAGVVEAIPNTLVRAGNAATVVIAAAEEVKADLIVLGTRGRTDDLGSVAECVVRARRPAGARGAGGAQRRVGGAGLPPPRVPRSGQVAAR